jgi:predicted AAA+ superfamily ATPase
LAAPEISACLIGRTIAFQVFPLSFAEYMAFREENGVSGDLHSELARYLRLGGFPEAHAIEHGPIGACNYLKIGGVPIGNETACSQVGQLERAFILHRCFSYDIMDKAVLEAQWKTYAADPALCSSVSGDTPIRETGIVENVVYLELLRRGYEVHAGQAPGGEIGFAAIRQGDKLYVQIARPTDSMETTLEVHERLLAIHDNYPKYVLGTSEFAGGNDEGIMTMHVSDFLLSEAF